MLAAFNGNSIFEGPGPLFCHSFGSLFGPFGSQRAHWGRLWAHDGGVGPAKVGSVGEAMKNGLSESPQLGSLQA